MGRERLSAVERLARPTSGGESEGVRACDAVRCGVAGQIRHQNRQHGSRQNHSRNTQLRSCVSGRKSERLASEQVVKWSFPRLPGRDDNYTAAVTLRKVAQERLPGPLLGTCFLLRGGLRCGNIPLAMPWSRSERERQIFTCKG